MKRLTEEQANSMLDGISRAYRTNEGVQKHESLRSELERIETLLKISLRNKQPEISLPHYRYLQDCGIEFVL